MTSMSSPMSRWSRGAVSWIRALMSTTRGGEDLPPRKREQLLGESRSPLTGGADLREIGLHRMIGGQIGTHQVGHAADHSKQVVEVVGHAAREPPHALHLLRVQQLGLQFPALTDVA